MRCFDPSFPPHIVNSVTRLGHIVTDMAGSLFILTLPNIFGTIFVSLLKRRENISRTNINNNI